MPARWLASSEKVKVIYKSQTEIFNSNGKINLKIKDSIIWHRFKITMDKMFKKLEDKFGILKKMKIIQWEIK